MAHARATTGVSASDIIERFGLQPLEGEGGYYRQTWVAPGEGHGPDPVGTAILYLVTPESWSALHRLRFDEVFHFYLGDPCEMVMVRGDGEVVDVRLGADILAGYRVQHVVPAGWWQGTRLADGGAWALLGTTMAPGFRPDAIELASEAVLDNVDPGHRGRVMRFLP